MRGAGRHGGGHGGPQPLMQVGVARGGAGLHAARGMNVGRGVVGGRGE